MALPTFTPAVNPQPGAKQKPEVRLLRADFGDGYTQVAPDGLNHIRKIWDLTWPVLSQTDAETIYGFFDNMGGCQDFLYTVPGTPNQFKWTCDEYDFSVEKNNTYGVTAKLKQSFNLDG